MAGKIKHLQITALLCVIAVALALFIGFAANNVYADTQTPVKYVDENGTEHQIGDYTVLTGSETEIGAAEETWYVANDNITFENNLKVNVQLMKVERGPSLSMFTGSDL